MSFENTAEKDLPQVFDSSFFGEKTMVKEYERWLRDMSREHLENERAGLYSSFIEEERAFAGERPFLSVVMRTQGRRPAELNAALRSLCEQTDQSFELILLGHKLSDGSKNSVLSIIESQPEDLRAKTRFFEVDFGNRTAPLNYGFAHARGSYIVSLDDDDLLFPDYVKALHKSDEEAGGRVIHSYGISQKWDKDENGEPFPVPGDDGTDDRFCRDFDLMFQLYKNNCYFTTMAFPRYIFHDIKIWFDENLETAEDWDFMMRCALILGVFDLRKSLSVYRLWQNSESSYTVHNRAVWDRTYEYILKKFAYYTIVFGSGSSEMLINSKKLIVAATGVVSKEPACGIGRIGSGKLYHLKGLAKAFIKPGSFFYGFASKIYRVLVKIRSRILDAKLK